MKTTYKVEVMTQIGNDKFDLAQANLTRKNALNLCRDLCGNHDCVRVSTARGKIIQQTVRTEIK